MRFGSCPGDDRLEAYLYKDLTFGAAFFMKLHLAGCKDCRKRLKCFRDFRDTLSSIPLSEPPEGYCERLLAVAGTWECPGGHKSFQPNRMFAPYRARLGWALGVVLFAATGLLQWRFGDSLPEPVKGHYFLSFGDAQALWSFVTSGAFLASLRDIVAAVKADGLSALVILGETILPRAAGVIVFGGVVSVMFVKSLRQPRSGGDRS